MYDFNLPDITNDIEVVHCDLNKKYRCRILNVKIDQDKTDHLYSYLTLRTDRELTTELNEWFCSGKHTAPFGPGTLLYWGRSHDK